LELVTLWSYQHQVTFFEEKNTPPNPKKQKILGWFSRQMLSGSRMDPRLAKNQRKDFCQATFFFSETISFLIQGQSHANVQGDFDSSGRRSKKKYAHVSEKRESSERKKRGLKLNMYIYIYMLLFLFMDL